MFKVLVGDKEPKRENHRIESAQGAICPNYMSGQVQINQDKIVCEIEESGMLEEPEGQVLLGGLEIDHQVHNAGSRRGKERHASKERGSSQVKYPSPLHSMHCTNLVDRINGRMTLEQCPYNLQPTLPSPARQ